MTATISDEQLEKILTRAILSAKQQVENSKYRPMHYGQHPKHMAYPRHPGAYAQENALRRQMMNMGRFGPRAFTVVRDPYTVYGGVSDLDDTSEWEDSSEEEDEEVMDPEDLKTADVVGKNGVKPKGEAVQGLESEAAAKGEEREDPALVENMEVPPTEEEAEEAKTTTTKD